jgi:hypothetical protein
MTLEKAVVTPLESQVVLVAEDDWIALGDTDQEHHISYGSVYAQSKWKCTDEYGSLIDWSDAPDNVKEAVCYYSLASLRGILFPDVNAQADASGGDITEVTKKLGTMQKTIKYDPPGAKAGNPLAYPNTLMESSCSLLGGSGSRKLVRC